MTDNQQVLVKLIREMNQICSENNWVYFAAEKYALQAYRSHGFENDAMDLTIRMPGDDFLEFAMWAEENLPADRYAESLINNPRFPRVAIYYGDRNTLDFRTDKWKLYDNHGIHLTIEPLRFQARNKLRQKIRGITETSWEVYADNTKAGKNRDRAHNAMTHIVSVVGQERLANKLFKYCLSTKYSKTDQIYRKKRWKTKPALYESSVFDGRIEIPFEGTVLWIPADYETYFFEWKTTWNTYDMSEKTYNPVRRIVDSTVPFADYLEELRLENIDEDDIWSTLRRYVAQNKELVLLRRKRKKAWSKLFRSSDRFMYWKQFHDSKLYIQELIKSGKADEVITYLDPYIQSMFEYNNNGLGLCFDKDIFDCVVKAYEMCGDAKYVDRMEQIRKRIPLKHFDEIKIKDHLGKEVESISMNGFRKATKEVVPAILEYLKRNVGDCVYMYVDIAKYGLENPNMDVWYDSNDEGISLVVMKYYDSIQVFTEEETWDVESASRLVSKIKPGMVSGRRDLIETLYPNNEEDYNLEIGYVFKLTNFMKFDDLAPIQRVGVEMCPEIAQFICTNDSIGGYYDVENLTDQLTERIETGIGRSLVILGEDGQLKGHIATYAEFDGIATTAGLLAVDDGTGIPYGTMLESKLVHDLLDEGFDIYTFVTEDRRAKFFRVMKCEELNRYGKMTLKK